MPDYYKVLQVQPDAEIEVIQAAYRRLSRKYHPDTNNSSNAHERMVIINEAYAVLSNPIKRAEYDQKSSSIKKEQRIRQDNTERIAAELAIRRIREEIQSLEMEINKWKNITQSYLAQKSQLPKPANTCSFIVAVILVGAFASLFFYGLIFLGADFWSCIGSLGMSILFIAMVVQHFGRLWNIKRINDIEKKYKEGMKQIEILQVVLDDKVAEYRHYQNTLGAL